MEEVRKGLEGNIEGIERGRKVVEKECDRVRRVMKEKMGEVEESKKRFLRYEGLKL